MDPFKEIKETPKRDLAKALRGEANEGRSLRQKAVSGARVHGLGLRAKSNTNMSEFIVA